MWPHDLTKLAVYLKLKFCTLISVVVLVASAEFTLHACITILAVTRKDFTFQDICSSRQKKNQVRGLVDTSQLYETAISEIKHWVRG